MKTIYFILAMCLSFECFGENKVNQDKNSNNYNDVISDNRQQIIDSAKQHDVDPILMEAIMRYESGHGKSYAAKKRNNYCGMKGGKKVYSSFKDCSDDLAFTLSKYRKKGRVTTKQIGRRYCPPNKRWAYNVDSIYKKVKEDHENNQ